MTRQGLSLSARSRLCVLLLAAAVSAYGQNVALDVQPRGVVPYRNSADFFSLGGGGALGATLDSASPFFLKASISYSYLPTLAGQPMSLVAGTVGGGIRIDLGSSLAFRIGAAAGGFVSLYDNLTAYNPSVVAESSVQWKFGGGFRLGIGGGYEYHVGSLAVSPSFAESAFLEGFNVFVGASFVPGAASGQQRRPRLEIGPPAFDPIFPVFYQYYNDKPLGTVSITNKERRTVSNVTVRFLVNQFMESPKLSLRIEKLDTGETVKVPILALFKDSILGVTEGTSVSAQILVDYEEGGEFLSSVRTETVKILKRNNLTWDDDRKAAAFVTANDPTVLRFARNIAAAIRGESVTAVNERLRIGMAIFQALNLYGMDYSIDSDSSYIELSKNDKALDMIQFPTQTLDFKAGDCDDLSVLYCSLLESVGIRTAFLTIPGHIYMAFALDMDETEAKRTYSRPEDLIFLNKEAWLPVEITMIRQNFLDAWTAGAKQWRENVPTKTAELFVVRDAWRTYPPTGFSSEALALSVPQTTVVVPNYSALLRRFIDREIAPQVSDLKARIQASKGNARLLNRLGTLYARYGLYDEAEREFLTATKSPEYPPALINLGNIARIKNDLRGAYKYYERARNVRSDDPAILLNLARVHFDLSEYPPASQRYREAELISPELVKDFNYIVSASSESGRASAAQKRQSVSWNEE